MNEQHLQMIVENFNRLNTNITTVFDLLKTVQKQINDLQIRINNVEITQQELLNNQENFNNTTPHQPTNTKSQFEIY